MLNFIKKLFKKESEFSLEEVQHKVATETLFSPQEINIDLSKKTILIIDDNEGVVSFLKNDLIELDQKDNKFNLDSYNVLTFSTKFCAFELEATLKEHNSLIIDFAIIDLTLGGTTMIDKKMIKYNGVDVFEMLYERNHFLNFCFYTGNKLNSYIKQNKTMIDKFYNITGNNMNDHLVFKTTLTKEQRQEKFLQALGY